MKKLTAYILCLLLTLTTVSANFTDLSEDYAWAMDGITTLSEKGVLNGYPDGSFRPEAMVSRAELAKLVCTLFGNKEKISYTDVTDDAWYAPYVSNSGGYFLAEEFFRPEESATREEVAYAVFMGLTETGMVPDRSIAFSDQADISEEYLSAVLCLNRAEILNGYPDGSFRPASNVTRAETATVLSRTLQIPTITPTPSPTPEETKKPELTTPFFLVSQISTVATDETGVATKVVGFSKGEKEELLIPDTVRIQSSERVNRTHLLPHDVISVTRDAFGEIRLISIQLNTRELPEDSEEELLPEGAGSRHSLYLGTVAQIYKKAIELVEHEADSYGLCDEVYVYLRQQNGKIAVSDLSEIIDSRRETGDTILAYGYDDEISEILILR